MQDVDGQVGNLGHSVLLHVVMEYQLGKCFSFLYITTHDQE